jgi:phosphopantothenoylcysteine decarboxylase/phosphopantothenate--cysteine ligase
MHTEMWEHAAVVENVAVLRRRGVHVVEPGSGALAGGDQGVGRLAGTEAIVSAVHGALAPRDLAGRRVLVTAGGTREPIDPVRYIANRSSGKQGHALADEAAARGAEVVLVTTVDLPAAAAEVVRVETAAEMEAVVRARAGSCDVVVMAAAVADFRPKAPSDHKLSKADGVPDLLLEPTPDIVTGLARERRPGQVLVGFAAGTGDVVAAAARKLAAKGLDLVVANDVSTPGAGFGHDENEVVVLGADGSRLDVPLTHKRRVASAVLDAVARQLRSST